MSFYLQMLREEEEFMGNTGFDDNMIGDPNGKDKYEVDIQDVADVIEDINADYVDQSSQDELDGQDLAEDPVNECMIAIYESEHNWNQIMQAIGTKELLEAFKGREMVMEAVDVKGFFTSVKNFFVKMWKKFTAIVKNWIDNAMAAFRTNKSFMTKYGSKLQAGKEAYEKDKTNKAFKGYNFKADKNFGEKVANDIVAEAKKNANSTRDWSGTINSMMNKNYAFDTLTQAVNSKLMSFNADKLRAQLISGNPEDKSATKGEGFRKALKVAYFGSEEKETLKGASLDPKTIGEILNRGNDDVKKIKKVYTEAKKAFDETIKALNTLERSVGKVDTADKDKSAAMNAITKMISDEKECKSAITMSSSMLMKALHAQKSQARKVANAYIFALNKSARKDKIEKANKIGESAGFFGSLELL